MTRGQIKQIIKNGIIQRLICNYYPHQPQNYHFNADRLMFYGHFRQIAMSNDITFVKRRSILFQKIFEYSQIMLNTVHHPFNLTVQERYGHHQSLIPLAAFFNGIFINNDETRRFYSWLKLNVN